MENSAKRLRALTKRQMYKNRECERERREKEYNYIHIVNVTHIHRSYININRIHRRSRVLSHNIGEVGLRARRAESTTRAHTESLTQLHTIIAWYGCRYTAVVAVVVAAVFIRCCVWCKTDTQTWLAYMWTLNAPRQYVYDTTTIIHHTRHIEVAYFARHFI